ncbi:hypothetical protein T07_3465 [Trichinella nelsoni]|uniref:Uncharacterized protein n=1 Tax=Trichinella nelsoni TaxID=6336 RepID=A0A0V0SFE2_9BILA|nr:hypothetical protein T07_3465 [Trichinella nelsoni]
MEINYFNVVGFADVGRCFVTFFGQSFLFTMKLIFCRISFGQMRRQIIDLVVGKRIASIISDLWYVE